jgi:hypothetical protein
MKSSICWDITPCSPLKVNRRFRGKYCLQIHGRSLPPASTVVSRSAYSSTLKSEATHSSKTYGWLSALYPRRQNSSILLLIWTSVVLDLWRCVVIFSSVFRYQRSYFSYSHPSSRTPHHAISPCRFATACCGTPPLVLQPLTSRKGDMKRHAISCVYIYIYVYDIILQKVVMVLHGEKISRSHIEKPQSLPRPFRLFSFLTKTSKAKQDTD